MVAGEKERDGSPLEIERNRDPRVREGYLSILEGPLQDWSELFSRRGKGGKEEFTRRVWKGDDDGGATGRTGSLSEMEDDGGGWVVVERREREGERERERERALTIFGKVARI